MGSSRKKRSLQDLYRLTFDDFVAKEPDLLMDFAIFDNCRSVDGRKLLAPVDLINLLTHTCDASHCGILRSVVFQGLVG